MFFDFTIPIGWGELLRRTAREVQDDRGLALAAQLAYYFFLSLFPTLLFLLALASFLPAEDLVGRVVTALQGTAPQPVFAPDVEQDFVWLTPGSLLAAVLWIGGSLGFRVYVTNFGSYNETYGAIGGAMVLLLWLYISGLVLVIGAELNSEIENASTRAAGSPAPAGRAGKRIIGPRARREQGRARQEAPGAGDLARRVPGPPRPAWPLRLGVLAVAACYGLVRSRRRA
jgi:membrane protein